MKCIINNTEYNVEIFPVSKGFSGIQIKLLQFLTKIKTTFIQLNYKENSKKHA